MLREFVMKIKIILFLLFTALGSQNIFVWAGNGENLDNVLKNEITQKALIPIVGLNNCYIADKGQYKIIVDEKENQLIDIQFRDVDTRVSPGNTLIVWYPVGMEDLRAGVLNENLEVIVPRSGDYYGKPEFIENDGDIYIKVYNGIDTDYYDLNGNKIDKSKEKLILTDSISLKTDTSYSKWAEESIIKSIKAGLVPKNLQYKYTDKITRQEFCQLAVQAYIAKTGNEIDMNVKTPFIDVDDVYITTAYNLKIVSGVGNDKFAPTSNITRQEAAVMLNNIAKVIGVNLSTPRAEKFIDEKYFAAWAKNDIYNITGVKSGDTFVMVGTEKGKFSPYVNYTKEQAIATMWRLFNI